MGSVRKASLSVFLFSLCHISNFASCWACAVHGGMLMLCLYLFWYFGIVLVHHLKSNEAKPDENHYLDLN